MCCLTYARMRLAKFAIAFLAATSAIAVVAVQELVPGVPLIRETIVLGSETKLYRLTDLQPGWTYEIRLSHPAWIPAEVQISIIPTNPGPTPGTLHKARPHRRLLDCDKLIFRTNQDLSVQGEAAPVVRVRAVRRGIHVGGPEAGRTSLIFDIVLQPLLLGCIPVDCLPVIGVCLVLLLALYWVVPYWSDHLVPQLLRWACEGEEEEGVTAALGGGLRRGPVGGERKTT
ncbi:hypothetical protein V8C86DRAFT_2532175 [Haematococcus lacustris]